MGERMMRIDEVAEILNVGRRTLERWIAAGEFPRADIRRGHKIMLWSPGSVRAWVDQETARTSARDRRPGRPAKQPA